MINRVNPTRSPNSTEVTRRSATGAGATKAGAPVQTAAPQLKQNRAPGTSSARHCSHADASAAPQPKQKRAPATSAVPHAAHVASAPPELMRGDYL